MRNVTYISLYSSKNFTYILGKGDTVKYVYIGIYNVLYVENFEDESEVYKLKLSLNHNMYHAKILF